MYHLSFAYPKVFYIFFPLWLLVIIYRLKFYKTPVYLFPLVQCFKGVGFGQKNYAKSILFFLRALFLFVLILLIARPQWVDRRSQINVDGVDIILALDVSGSMQMFDDLQDRRMRIDVAKQEAIRFIDKRVDDPIGLVIFGADAISRCPLTLDKSILKSIVHETRLGFLNPAATALGTGLATAVNKLRTSKAKSKVIILLTDGQPTPEAEKVSVDDAVSFAKQFGIKIYTVAIGNRGGGYIQTVLGLQQAPDSVNEQLLEQVAQETNGKFFRANNPREMKTIYDTIDTLEKSERTTNLFSRYYEAFASFIWIVLLILAFELFLRLLVWRGVI